MKKSLLMTIIMSLVLVVAMSTATYAWYTSSDRVTVAETEVTAATSSSSNLAIGATAGGKETSATIVMSGGLIPMIPTAEWVIGTSAYDNVEFKTATQTADSKFSNDVTSATPSKISKVGSATQPDLYVSNLNKDAAVNVNATVTIKDTDSRGLCVALFAGNKLIGVWGNDVHYGTITAGQAVSSINTTMQAGEGKVVVASGNAHSVGEIAASGNVKINIIAWFDGADLNDGLAGGSASFDISFSAVNPNA